MLSNLILYHSLTQTQKASSELTYEGIKNRIIRAPGKLSKEGCSYCIRISQRDLFRAYEFLQAKNLIPLRIFVTAGDGNFEEVHL